MIFTFVYVDTSNAYTQCVCIVHNNLIVHRVHVVYLMLMYRMYAQNRPPAIPFLCGLVHVHVLIGVHVHLRAGPVKTRL